MGLSSDEKANQFYEKRKKKEKEKEKWKERENSLHYVISDNSLRATNVILRKGRKKAKNEVCYIRHRCPHVSPHNFVVPLNIF